MEPHGIVYEYEQKLLHEETDEIQIKTSHTCLKLVECNLHT